MNPNTVNFYILGTSLGYAIDGTEGGAIGLAIASGIMFVLSWFF